MFAPSHPGAILKDSLDVLGLSVAQAAEALGVDRSGFHRVVSEKSAISPELAIRLEAVIGSSAEHWLRMQATYDLARTRAAKPELIKQLRRCQPA